MSEAIPDDPHRAMVETARARAKTPGLLLAGLGVAMFAASVALYVLAKLDGQFYMPLLAIGTTGPAILVALGGWMLRRLRAWNVVFAGLLTGIAAWIGVMFMAVYFGQDGVSWIGVPLCLFDAVALVALARFGEAHVIRDARTLLERKADRDPSDAMPF